MSHEAVPIRLESRSSEACRDTRNASWTGDWTMPTFTYPNPGRSFVRPAILLLAVAGTSYVVGVLLQNPISSRDVSALLAAPAQAAESNFANPLQVTGTVASV